MKRALVTGATGFVGANLARRLLKDGHEVHLLVRPGFNAWRIEEIRQDVHLHELHLHDEPSVQRVVDSVRPEWIFHLAAHGAYSWQRDVQEMVRANLLVTIALVNACVKIGFESFINTGSSSEYGYKDHPPSENEAIEPNSHYAVTKASATMFCRYTAQSQRVHLPTLRLYSVFGPYESPGRLMPTLILRGLKGELPPLVDPNIARDFVYTDDVSDAYILAATKQTGELGPIYNVGTGAEIRMKEVVEIARRVMNIRTEPVWGTMPNRQWDATVWVSDNRKICSQLAWKPRHHFEQGLRKMMEWFGSEPRSVYLNQPPG